LEYEHNLRQAIEQLKEWRTKQIGTLKEGEKYELEKQQRAARPAPVAAFDRLASSRPIHKPTAPVETPTAASQLTAPDLPPHLQTGLPTPPDSLSPSDKVLTNGNGNGAVNPQRPKFVCQPLPNTAPLKFKDENVADLHLLTPDEREVCSTLRLMPKPYIAIKESVLREAVKHGGSLKKKTAREICKIDVNKGSRLFEFFVHSGWIAKA